MAYGSGKPKARRRMAGGREVKDEIGNENGNQTSKDFGFHIWVAVGS